MKRFLVIFLVLPLVLFAGIDSSIVKNSKILKQKKITANIIKDKLEDIAKSIDNKKRELAKIDEQIKQSNQYIIEQKAQFDKKVKELNDLQQQIGSLNKTRDTLKEKIIKLISKELSLEIVAEGGNQEDVENVINKEVILSLSKIMKNKFNDIKQQYVSVNNKIDGVTTKIKELKSYIAKMKKKKILLSSMKSKRLKSINYLKRQKIAYDKKLNRIFAEQEAIKKTLSRLNILKQQMIKKKRRKLLAKTNINNQKVRQIGTSYQASRVAQYRGPKTIAPLRSFYIKRKFGNYFDPIYKIKIFNESVVLGSKIPNAKVRNVLNGKVVFAKSTPMLDNVVIVENSNGIHTIYAHLSKIAPTIKEGKRIRKGYIIGRIKDELTFEVTQKNKHINPLRLIRF